MMAATLLGACATKPAPAPAPAAPVPEAPVVALPPPPAIAPAGWPDLPLTPGDWTYGADASGSRATFAAGFVVRCESGRIYLAREGAAGPLRLSTTFGERVVAAGAALAADDPGLDEMAYSRGRFAVDAEGTERLIIPAWPEPARVIEDCRG